MNLILHPLQNPNDPVWCVIISIIILLAGVSYYIVYIMRMAFDELSDGRSNQPKRRGPGPTPSTPDTQD